MDDPYEDEEEQQNDPFYAENDPFDNPAQYGDPNPYFNGAKKMKFREGDEVEVTGNMSGANQMGNTFTVQSYLNGFVRLVGSPYNFYEQDLALIAPNKERVKKRCDEARNAYHLWQAKLDYMEEEHKEELEDSEFKKHQLKKLIDNGNISAEDKIER